MSSNVYMKNYMKKRYKEKRKHLFQLLGNKCSNCNSQKNLEVDHIDPRKKSFTLAEKWNNAEKIILAEISKCQLLCKKCHIVKTRKDICKIRTGYEEQPHGTYWKYKKYNCRCKLCITAFREKNKIYKQNTILNKLASLV